MTIPEPAFATDRAVLVARLRTILPANCLLVDDEDLRPYECDGLTAFRELPLAVCLPESEGQVIDVLRTCHQLGVPVVARGAGTGLSGGAMPQGLGVASYPVVERWQWVWIWMGDPALADPGLIPDLAGFGLGQPDWHSETSVTLAIRPARFTSRALIASKSASTPAQSLSTRSAKRRKNSRFSTPSINSSIR